MVINVALRPWFRSYTLQSDETDAKRPFRNRSGTHAVTPVADES